MIVIKGCLYYSGDMILRPHYSGQFNMVDCDEYITKAELKDRYDDYHVKKFMEEGTCIVYKGIEHYQAESGPYHVSAEDFELLSYIGDVSFYDEETNFDT